VSVVSREDRKKVEKIKRRQKEGREGP
jgi:hypothetical protein